MSVHLLNADARHIPLADESVQCVITSPPYYGLRDYGTATWVGGSAECDHKVRSGGESMLEGASQRGRSDVAKGDCPKCGATRVDRQIGLERTPQEYVDGLVSVFREVWRVCKPSATVWLNLGDSYASQSAGNKIPSGFSQIGGKRNGKLHEYNTQSKGWGDAKPKDLLGIPWRVAFALQADGWYLRSDIIWSKPNPMPESVTDRPTKAHEYIFLLSKSERYFYNIDSIREPHTTENLEYEKKKISKRKGISADNTNCRVDREYNASDGTNGLYHPMGRNKRTVWEIATSPYAEAHFATFPPDLVLPMVLAGSKPGDVVLDPFSGTATVGKVAIENARRFVGLELNPAYIKLAEKRVTTTIGMGI